jgi:hypothetical protein
VRGQVEAELKSACAQHKEPACKTLLADFGVSQQQAEADTKNAAAAVNRDLANMRRAQGACYTTCNTGYQKCMNENQCVVGSTLSTGNITNNACEAQCQRKYQMCNSSCR